MERWCRPLVRPDYEKGTDHHDQVLFEEHTLRDAPPWVNGLRYATDAKTLDEDHYIQWDYGLSMDLEMLCNHRRGRVPFEFMPHLWTILYGCRVLSCE